MRVIVEIPSEKYQILSAFLDKFEFRHRIETESETFTEPTKSEILDGLKEAFAEVESHQKGETKLKTFQEMLNEL